VSLYVLVVLLLFLSLNALIGGGLLIFQPDGTLLGFPDNWIDRSPFSSYLLPGLILFTANGVLPALAIVGLVTKRPWRWTRLINIYSGRHWSWAFSLYAGIISIAWIGAQLLMTPGFWLQSVIIFNGLGIIICTLLPNMMKYLEQPLHRGG
jgi:hypothetical protein